MSVGGKNKVYICKDTGEKPVGYDNYLMSKHWNELRKTVAERDKYTCLRCESIFKEGYHIHHNT